MMSDSEETKPAALSIVELRLAVCISQLFVGYVVS